MATKVVLKKEFLDSKNIGFKRGIQMVNEFHKTFGCVVSDLPTLLTEAEYDMRYKLMEEENNEYLEACENGDLEGIADALGDKMYILFGTIIAHGMQDIIEDVFVEIHRSNMSKLNEDGNPIINGENGVMDEEKPVGKVMKSDSYSPPDIESIIKNLFENKLKSKFLDDEMKEILEKKYEERDEKMRSIIQDNMTKTDFKKFERFEFLADYFSEKVQLIQQRTSFDQTKFGVRIDGETHWIDEKEEGDY